LCFKDSFNILEKKVSLFSELNFLTTLLLGDTDSSPAATGSLGVLSTNTERPHVTETTVRANLTKPLQILTELGVHGVRDDLSVGAVLDVSLPVKEVDGDLVGKGVLDDIDQLVDFFLGKLTGALVHVNIGLLADNVSESATNTTNLGQGEHDLMTTFDVGVVHTKNVLELVFLQNHRHLDHAFG